MSQSNSLIAGRHGGKKVYIVPAVKPAFDLLNQKAVAGNHWARLAVSGITNLSSGRIGKDNVYVRPNLAVAHGIEEFFVFLPGCKASVERLPNDTYKVVNLTVDMGCFAVNAENSMTGLYAASKHRNEWHVKYIDTGELTNETATGGFTIQRIVGISDGKYGNAFEAADNMAALVTKAPRGKDTATQRYDLHFTKPKKAKSFGGLKNYSLAANPLNNTELYGSAQMLAHTMLRAKNIEGMNWVSEFGGSAVLTQAMKILVEKGVTLKDHSAFLYRPNTNANEAVELAHKLEMQLDRKFLHTHSLDYMGNRDQLRLIFNRRKTEAGYTVGNACFDLVCHGKNIHGAAALGITAATAIGASIAFPAIPILSKIGAALGVGATALKTGDSLAEYVCPRYYNKHIGKIK